MADQKLTQLTALATLSSDDLFYVVDDPAGAATSKKMAASVLDGRYLQPANNLSDLANAATARTNLGLVAGGAGDIWVEKAGDTMTGLLTYAQPAGDTATFYTVNPSDPDARLFNWNIATSNNPFIARRNTIINWGYNQAVGGGCEDGAEPSFYQQLESHYAPGSDPQFEYHWDFFTDGGDGGIRPMHLNCEHVSGDIEMFWYTDRMLFSAAHDGQFALVDFQAGATLETSLVTVAAPSRFSNLITFNQTTHAGIQLNSLTTTQKNALTGANGMLLYDSTLGRMQGYIAGAWATLYSAGGTDVAIADGGTGQSTAQLGINALTNVAAATNEYVLTKDTASGNAIFKVSASGSALPVDDGTAIIKGSADATKLLRFEVDGFSAGATRVMTPPNQDTTLAGQNFANLFTVAQTITAATATVIPLTIKTTDNSVTNPALRVLSSADAVVASIGATGIVNTTTHYQIAGNRFLHQTGGVTNAFVGVVAGTLTATGTENVGVGTSSLGSLTSGTNNVGVGYGTLSAITTGSNNVAIGRRTLISYTGSNTIAIGTSALSSLSSGTGNTAVGTSALAAVATANGCTAIGSSALLTITGLSNTGIGEGAGTGAITAQYCTFLSANTSATLSSASASVAIGYGAVVTASQQLVIGWGHSSGVWTINDVYIGGGVTGTATSQSVAINATGGEGTDKAGANITIAGGKPTGSGVGGSVILSTAPAGATGTALRALVTRLTLDSTGLITLADVVNFAFNTGTGTKFGTAVGQKMSFWNAAPIVQPASANQAALTNSTGGTYDGTLAAIAGTGDDAGINNNFTDIFTLLNAMRTAMVDSGLMKGAA